MPTYWATAVCRGTGRGQGETSEESDGVSSGRGKGRGSSWTSASADQEQPRAERPGGAVAADGAGEDGGGRAAESYDIGSETDGWDRRSAWGSYSGENWSWSDRSDYSNWQWVKEPDAWWDWHAG